MSALHEKIKKTLDDFKSLSLEMNQKNLDTKAIESIIKNLESHSVASSMTENISKDSTDRALHQIFLFYAKQQRLVKPCSTFEDYYQDSTTMSVGEFLVFCKDFRIFSKDRLSRKELIEIFRVNCSFKKEMNEGEFNQTLQYLANKLYVGSPKETLGKLYEFIRIDNKEYVKNACKGFSLPFSNEKINYRSPVYRIKMPSDKFLPRVSQIMPSRYQSTKTISKSHKQPLIPCDAIVTEIKKNSYSANLIKKLNPMTFTWQTLSSLHSEQLVSSDYLDGLIVRAEDSDEEILAKHYGSLKSTPSLLLENPK